MVSNSKLTLTKAQKIERMEMLDNLPTGWTMAQGYRMTVLAIPDTSVTRIFSAVMSFKELKFRPKVGEYHAMARFYDDANGGLILPGNWTATEFLAALFE